MLHINLIVAKDPAEAKKWFNKGAAAGNSASKRALVQLRRNEQNKSKKDFGKIILEF